MSVGMSCVQCFDALGWAARRASGLLKTAWLGAPSSKSLHQQNPPVLNWRCRLTQVACIMAVKRWLLLVTFLNSGLLFVLSVFGSFCFTVGHVTIMLTYDWI